MPKIKKSEYQYPRWMHATGSRSMRCETRILNRELWELQAKSESVKSVSDLPDGILVIIFNYVLAADGGQYNTSLPKVSSFFCSTDVIGLCTGSVSLLSEQQSHLFSSVWVYRNKSITKLSNFYSRNDFVCTLLLLCGDIEIQPGPNNVEMTELMANRGIKVLHQNVRGLFVNFEKIEIFLTNFKNTDILTLSETHINTHNNISDLYFIPGYTFLHRKRKKGNGGGAGSNSMEKKE